MYTYIDSRGQTQFPSRDQVVELARNNGIVTALVIDANVCLDLADMSRGTLPSARRSAVEAFVRSIAASGVDVLPGFGSAELVLDRRTWKLDAMRLESLDRNISIALNSVPGPDSHSAATAVDFGPVDVGLFRPYICLFQVFYASLLKIFLISMQGLGRHRAFRNVETFLQWMSDDLNCVSAIALQVAIAIFGGDSLARRVIGVDKQNSSLHSVWGGARDLFYIHQLYHNTVFELDGMPHYPVFVTRDRACYELFSRSQ